MIWINRPPKFLTNAEAYIYLTLMVYPGKSLSKFIRPIPGWPSPLRLNIIYSGYCTVVLLNLGLYIIGMKINTAPIVCC